MKQENSAQQVDEEAVLDGDLTTYSDELTINTTTDRYQNDPSVAYIGDGTVAFSWISTEQGNDYVYTRLYDEAGNPLSDEILVNTDFSGDFSETRIVQYGDGSFYVTWTETDDSTLPETETQWAAIVDSSGNIVLDPFEYDENDAPDLRLAPHFHLFDDDSRVVATTVKYFIGSSFEITNIDVKIAVYTLDPVAEVLSSTAINGDESSDRERSPTVVEMADGGFLLLWQTGSGSYPQLEAQRYDNTGTEQGDSFVVANYLYEKDDDPAVLVTANNVSAALLSDGSYVIVWEAFSIDGSGAADGDGTAIMGRRYSADDEPLTDAFIINDVTDGYQYTPTVTALESGGYVVTWQTPDPEGFGYDISAVFYEVPLYGSDATIGSDTSDSLTGTSEGDTLVGLDGNDQLDGLTGADSLYGGAGGDTLTGGGGNDRLYGGAGHDVLSGDGGNDVLYGDTGNDSFDGGAGNDTANYFESAAAVTLDLTDGGSTGQAKGDTYVNIEHVTGSKRSDDITGDGSDNRLKGMDGWDTLSGAGGDDTLEGGGGNDKLHGGSGDDVLSGGRRSDDLSGGEGNDTLTGGAGFDTLTGGAGNDVLTGGFHADVFVFAAGSGTDTITDFEADKDSLDLSAVTANFTNLASVEAAATATETGLLIDLGGGDSVLLTGIDMDDLVADNFIF